MMAGAESTDFQQYLLYKYLIFWDCSSATMGEQLFSETVWNGELGCLTGKE
jgi:hypothetical protein